MAHHGGDHGPMNLHHMPAYVTSKAALIPRSELLASEVLPHGVAVFAVQPGTCAKRAGKDLLSSSEGQQWLPWFRQIFKSQIQ